LNGATYDLSLNAPGELLFDFGVKIWVSIWGYEYENEKK